jgi:hypothetical protein
MGGIPRSAAQFPELHERLNAVRAQASDQCDTMDSGTASGYLLLEALHGLRFPDSKKVPTTFLMDIKKLFTQEEEVVIKIDPKTQYAALMFAALGLTNEKWDLQNISQLPVLDKKL